MSEDDFVIYKYTRAEAIEDGVLIDQPLTGLAHQYGINFHCAMSQALYALIKPPGTGEEVTKEIEWRMWDMLTMFRDAVWYDQNKSHQLTFVFGLTKRPGQFEEITVKAVCGPGDDETPVLTFMLPDED